MCVGAWTAALAASYVPPPPPALTFTPDFPLPRHVAHTEDPLYAPLELARPVRPPWVVLASVRFPYITPDGEIPACAGLGR
jgi:hypothetical protein